MKIELKEKEKEFYYSILSKFYSKINHIWPITEKNISFSNFSNENFRIFYGITKIVLIPKNKGARYVLKIPKGDHDYCNAEEQVYTQAIEFGVDKFFAPIELFDRDNYDFPVYIQLRTVANLYTDDDDYYEAEEDWSGLSQESIEAVMDMDISEKVIDELLRAYPSEEIEGLLAFCREENVNDVHAGNFGWYKDEPIIFDYSGVGIEVCKLRGI